MLDIKIACQKWDLNPRLQRRLRPERSALDRSAILTSHWTLSEPLRKRKILCLRPYWQNISISTTFPIIGDNLQSYVPQTVILETHVALRLPACGCYAVDSSR